MVQYRNHRGVERVSDHESRMVFSTGARQYNRGNGWHDIDTTLESIGLNHWFMDKAPYACAIPKRADTGVRFEYEGGGFSWIPLCAPVYGVATCPNVVTYKDAFGDGVHLELSAGHNSLKKLIVIEKRPRAAGDYLAFYFKMPCDAKPGIRGRFRGLISLFENRAYIWQATVIDANGRVASIPLDFAVINGDLHMVKRIPRQVLDTFTYPLKTDADASYSAGTGDGYLAIYGTVWSTKHDAASGDNASYSATDIYVGCNSLWIYRAFFPFDTTALPAGAQVTAATLNVSRLSGGNANMRLTETFQASTSSLATADYEDNGYDAGHETGARAKYAPTVAGCDTDHSVIHPFIMNATGRAWVKADAATWTKLGLRYYGDCDNVPSYPGAPVLASSNHSDSNLHPTLDVTYQTDFVAPTPSGGLGWGGGATIATALSHAGSGGFGIGGAARIVGPVQYDTSNAFSLASSIKEVVEAVASSTAVGYNITSATQYYRRPYLTWHSGNTSETTIQLTWLGAIDTLLLYNCNFTDFEIDIAASEEFETIQDINTGFYNGIVRLNQTASGIYTASTNTLIITIPAQTPTDGESYFKIGSIVGAVRQQLTFPPRYPYKKEFIEPARRRDFDSGAKEVEVAGNPYHLLEYGWDAISYDNFHEIEQVVRNIDIIGACIVHEKWSDYEAVYLCTMIGDFDFSVDNRDRISARLTFREFN